MQERCPNCGDYAVGPAYPVRERNFAALAAVCCAVAAFVGCVVGGRAVYFFFSVNPGTAVTAAFVVCGGLVAGLIAWFPFSLGHDRRAAQRAGLAHFRRCGTCGFRWDTAAP